MKKILPFTIFTLLNFIGNVTFTFAQQHFALDWVKTLPERDHVRASNMTVDANKNMINFGWYMGLVDFDPGPGISLMGSPSFMNSKYIQKLDSLGNYQWSRSFDYFLDAKAFSTDVDGNIYVLGNFSTTMDFDPGPGEYLMSPTASDDVFVLKLDANGNYVWSHRFGGTAIDQGVDIKVNNNNNQVIITGLFRNTTDFNPGVGLVSKTTVPHNLANTFVLSLDTAGNYNFVRHFYGSYNAPFKLHIDKYNNIFLTGEYYGEVTFTDGVGPNAVATEWDNYIVKLSPTGATLMVKVFADAFASNFNNILTDSDDNIYIQGTFSDTIDFDPGIATQMRYPRGGFDLFLLKLNSLGEYVWVKEFGNESTIDYGGRLLINNNNNMFMNVGANGKLTFPTDTGTDSIISMGANDAVILEFDTSGNVVHTTKIASTGDEKIVGFQLVSENEIYLNGNFNTPLDFDPNHGEHIVDTVGWDDVFFLKLKTCTPISTPLTSISACEYYILGEDTLYASGIYTDTLQRINGCDSIVQINLTITGDGNLVMENATINTAIIDDTISIYNADCHLLATIGSAEDLGIVSTGVEIDTEESSYNGQPYLKRHYHITSTRSGNAWLTLYFTPDEFISFNDNNGTYEDIDLDDDASNLKITAFHSIRGSGTGLLGYDTAASTIEVISPMVVWNDIANRWEVSFNTSGFSGFFAHTSPLSEPLSVDIKSFEVNTQNDEHHLKWELTNLSNINKCIIERSKDAVTFEQIGIGNNISLRNVFVDKNPLPNESFYRIQVVYNDASTKYSPIRKAILPFQNVISIHPNPTVDKLSIRLEKPIDFWEIELFDINGKRLQYKSQHRSNTSMISLSDYPAGSYVLKIHIDNTSSTHTIIKQ